jgi:hypothetical protein
MRRDPLPGPAKGVAHVVVVALGWALFGYWWYEVAIKDWDKTDVALIILVTLVVAPTVTLIWVAHNLYLFRRKGPRLSVPASSLEYAHDWNNRRVSADWNRLRDPGVVVISVDGDRKLYRVETTVPARTAATVDPV